MNVQTETLKSLRKDIEPSLSPGFPRFLDPWWSLALSLALFIFPEIHRTQGPRFGEIAAGPVKACNQAGPERIGAAQEDDRYRRGCGLYGV